MCKYQRNKVENKRWPQKQETSASVLRSHDRHRGREQPVGHGFQDSDDDEICWKSMMAIAPPARCGSHQWEWPQEVRTSLRASPGGEFPNGNTIGGRVAHLGEGRPLLQPLPPLISRGGGDGAIREGEWDEISADAEQMGRTLARRRYQQRRWPQGPPVKHAMRWGQACQSSVVS